MTILLGCLIWFPLAIWIYSLIAWSITGDIDPVAGILGVVLGIGLGVTSFSPPSPAISVICFVGVWAAVLLYLPIRQGMTQRQLRAIDVEQMEKACNALGMRPTNPSAQFKVAQCAFQLGMRGHAIAIGERALGSLQPGNYGDPFREERRQLGQWKTWPLTSQETAPLECLRCGHANTPGEIFCAACGHSFLVDRARRRFAPSRFARKIVAAWVAMVALLGVIPLSSGLPALAQIVVIVLTLAAAGLILFRAFGGGVGD